MLKTMDRIATCFEEGGDENVEYGDSSPRWL